MIMTKGTTMDTAFNEFIVLEEISTLGQLKLCKATTNGSKIKKGDEFLAKHFQIVKFEVGNGYKLRVKESHIIGYYEGK